jgi:transcription elongation GreA/GreB family factor
MTDQEVEATKDVPAVPPVVPVEESKRVQGLTKTVNDLLGAFGVSNKDEALALAKRMKESGSSAEPTPTPSPVSRTAPTSSDGRPKTPRLSDFIDPALGYPDATATAKYDEAREAHDAALEEWRNMDSDKRTAKTLADSAVSQAVDGMPAWVKGGEEDDDSDAVRASISQRASALAGGKIPTVAQVQQAAKDVQAGLERAATRKLNTANAEADDARKKDPAKASASGAPAAQGEDEIKPPPLGASFDEKQAYAKAVAKRNRGG